MALQHEHEMEPDEESVMHTSTEVIGPAKELMGSIGQTLESAAQQTKKSANAAMEAVAEGVDISSKYLTGRGMAGVTKDVEKLIRRYPFQVLMFGVSVGYLLSRSRQR